MKSGIPNLSPGTKFRSGSIVGIVVVVVSGVVVVELTRELGTKVVGPALRAGKVKIPGARVAVRVVGVNLSLYQEPDGNS